MVALDEVIASNKQISSTFPDGLVAVFVGGTSGVGEYTLTRLAKYAAKPKIYLVGRSQEAADRIIAVGQRLNPQAKFVFYPSDVSLLKNVDEISRKIKEQEDVINILCLSTGTMAFEQVTDEGVPLASGLIIHSRIRFILNLLPLVRRATSLRRVVSVAAGTCEGAVDLDNIWAKGVPMRQWQGQVATIETLLLEQVAQKAPEVPFVHDIPGLVPSGIFRTATGLRMRIMVGLSKLLGPVVATPPEESGERHVFLATSAKFVAGKGGVSAAGVPLDNSQTMARGTDGKVASGVYSLSNKCDSAPEKVEGLLAKYRADGTAKMAWDALMADFNKITGIQWLA